jgi:hypothetical protein
MAILETFPSQNELKIRRQRVGVYPSEKLLPVHGTAADRNGYKYDLYPIEDELGEVGRSVLLVMQQYGSTQPMKIIGPAVFQVRPVLGRGVLLHTPASRKHFGGEQVRVTYMDASRQSHRERSLEIGPDESSMFINIGEEPFVVRDDAYPDYQDGYEAPSDDPYLLQRAATYNIQAAANRLFELRLNLNLNLND